MNRIIRMFDFLAVVHGSSARRLEGALLRALNERTLL